MTYQKELEKYQVHRRIRGTNDWIRPAFRPLHLLDGIILRPFGSHAAIRFEFRATGEASRVRYRSAAAPGISGILARTALFFVGASDIGKP